jgi:DNA-binding beta-propeller fold protein YncE
MQGAQIAMFRFAMLVCCLLGAGWALQAQTTPALHLEREIPLSQVEGRVDHLSADVAGKRVFVAALGNDTVEVVDLRLGRRVARIAGLHEPQGVLYLAANKTLYVAGGDDGKVRSFDGRTLQSLKIVNLGEDADDLRYDPVHGEVLAGYGTGGIAMLGLDLTRRADLHLPVHPEAFEVSGDGKELFVNLPHNRSIGKVDLTTRAVNAQWADPGAEANYPMALDSSGNRLYVACRQPGELVQLNAASGAVLAQISTVGDADDLFFDRARGVLYVIGGEGYIDVIQVGSGKTTKSVAHIPTQPGARTGLFVPEWNELLVAAPRRGQNPARLLVFSIAAK